MKKDIKNQLKFKKSYTTNTNGKRCSWLCTNWDWKDWFFCYTLIEILNSGKSKSRMPRCLILTPTRELAMQVSEEFNLLNKHFKLQMALLIGGVSLQNKTKTL